MSLCFFIAASLITRSSSSNVIIRLPPGIVNNTLDYLHSYYIPKTPQLSTPQFTQDVPPLPHKCLDDRVVEVVEVARRDILNQKEASGSASRPRPIYVQLDNCVTAKGLKR